MKLKSRMGIFAFILNIKCSSVQANTRHWDISRKNPGKRGETHRKEGKKRQQWMNGKVAGEGSAPVRETGGAQTS